MISHFPFFSKKSPDKRSHIPAASALLPPHFPALAAFLLLLALGAVRLLASPPDFLLSEDARFARFTDAVFQNELRGNTLNLHYTIADPKAYHIKTDGASLGDLSPDACRRANASAENYFNALKTFHREKLSENHRLTYDIFYKHLDTELSAASLFLYEEPLSPTLGIQAQLPVLLAEYPFRTKGDIENYLSLLSQVPDYFSSILAFEREKSAAGLFMSSDSASEVIRQCREFTDHPEENYLLQLFNEKIDSVKNLTADEKIACKSRNEALVSGYVLPAYADLIDGITALAGSGTNEKGLYYFPEGKAYYEYLIKSRVGDDRPIEKIEEAVKKQMVADYTAIGKLMRQIKGAETSVQTSAADNPAAILDELRRKITADFPLLPAVSCRVKYVHPSLQKYLSPAFYLTPAIDDYANNIIYINPSSKYSGLALFTTLAHEGYPGHLYQSVYFNSRKPDLLRCLLDTGGYTEGWATYVEMYAYSWWNDDPVRTALSQKNRAFTLGLASLLDIGIHYRGYSLEDVTAFLQKLGFAKSTAESLYRSILQSPGNYLQYYVGCLNFCSLRDTLKKQQGAHFSLKEFHRAVLDIGPAPFSILQRELLSPE